jgi:hypothetical protein
VPVAGLHVEDLLADPRPSADEPRPEMLDCGEQRRALRTTCSPPTGGGERRAAVDERSRLVEMPAAGTCHDHRGGTVIAPSSARQPGDLHAADLQQRFGTRRDEVLRRRARTNSSESR